jgi:thiol-disulfide isomerase/thioredoxin
VRPPVDTITAPPFPRDLQWINVAALRMDQQLGRPVLIEFWDFCRPNSIRTLPYLEAWHERYADAGLRVIGVHSPGFPPSTDPAAVRAAVARLGIPYPVAVDPELEVWDLYGNQGWPARYLFDRSLTLVDFHYGEGAYDEAEQAIAGLLDVEAPPFAPLRPEDAPGAVLVPQTPDQPGAYAGPYEAGGVWAVVSGAGEVRANERAFAVDAPGCVALVEHDRSTAGVIEVTASPGVTVHATCFTPGLASA